MMKRSKAVKKGPQAEAKDAVVEVVEASEAAPRIADEKAPDREGLFGRESLGRELNAVFFIQSAI